MVAGHRIRGGVGEMLTDWVVTEIERRGAEAVQLDPRIPRRSDLRAAVAVLPTYTTLPAREQAARAALCAGLTVEVVRYGVPATRSTAPPMITDMRRAGALVDEVGLTVPANPPPGPVRSDFEQLALQLLLDRLMLGLHRAEPLP